ncbi:MAG: DegT/DnrJ/EryC1/StrS family aminotransferase [Thermoguttaceae bacterium]|jgi:dTDP-4-amino-4,6-dideoxygalactose transaminase
MIALTGPCFEESDFQQLYEAIQRKAVAEGDITRAFEEDCRAFLAGAGAVATNSCTSALVLALAALDIVPGDEVILPSYTCLAVLNAVVQVGATPRLTDNAYSAAQMDYNMTADVARRAISTKTRAVVVPHMFGVPAAIDEIARLGIAVVEDITLSLGAYYKGKPVGAWGDIAVCSFHSSKMIACGEGGMLVANTPSLYEKVRYLNGWEAEQPALRVAEHSAEPYRLRYSFRLSDVASALGRSQLRKLPAFVARRRDLASRYTERLADIPHLTLPGVNQESNVFFRYLVALQAGNVVEVIRRFTAAGIEVGRGVYPPLHRYLGLDAADYPGAEHAVGTLLSIPLYPALSDEEVEYILATSRSVLSGTET